MNTTKIVAALEDLKRQRSIIDSAIGQLEAVLLMASGVADGANTEPAPKVLIHKLWQDGPQNHQGASRTYIG